MRRVAWFHVVIETEDEVSAVEWLGAMTQLVDACAVDLSRGLESRVKMVSPIEAGQSFPIAETELVDRDDV